MNTVDALVNACWAGQNIARLALADYLEENGEEFRPSLFVGCGYGVYGYVIYGDGYGGGDVYGNGDVYGDGDGRDGVDGGGGDVYGDGGGGDGDGDYSKNFYMKEAMMFTVGQLVQVNLRSGYSPLYLMGRVSKLIGVEGAELEDAVCVHRCTDGRWAELAEGNLDLATRVVYAGKYTFASCIGFRDAVTIPPVTVR